MISDREFEAILMDESKRVDVDIEWRPDSPHKHKWSADFRDWQAYMPSDVTAQWHEPVRAWGQFRAEARIVHLGRLGEPSRIGEERL